MAQHTANYIAELQKKQATGVAIEHAYRPALQYYLEGLLPTYRPSTTPNARNAARQIIS